MQPADLRKLRLSVNFHLIEKCNAKCKYCFATFPNLHRKHRLSPSDQEKLIDVLVDYGIKKINFAGGEPTLVPHLGSLCRRIKDRSQGGCAVSLVTNGMKLGPLLEDYAPWIDWVALSVDSGDDETNADLGRSKKGQPYASTMLELGERAKQLGIRLKCNTVVTRHNVGEDMSDFLSTLLPERWKILQFLPVIGENDRAMEQMSISDKEYQAFVMRHENLVDDLVEIVPENNDAMTNSYLMIGPDGRFFWHVGEGCDRSLRGGAPILEVGVGEALRQVHFSAEKFRDRGGRYDWDRDRRIPIVQNP